MRNVSQFSFDERARLLNAVVHTVAKKNCDRRCNDFEMSRSAMMFDVLTCKLLLLRAIIRRSGDESILLRHREWQRISIWLAMRRESKRSDTLRTLNRKSEGGGRKKKVFFSCFGWFRFFPIHHLMEARHSSRMLSVSSLKFHLPPALAQRKRGEKKAI